MKQCFQKQTELGQMAEGGDSIQLNQQKMILILQMRQNPKVVMDDLKPMS
jgi:hypothetical protein